MSKLVSKTVQSATYVLELSEEEAQALLALTGKIGGDPDGVRGIFSDRPTSLRAVLQAAGVRVSNVPSLFVEYACYKYGDPKTAYITP